MAQLRVEPRTLVFESEKHHKVGTEAERFATDWKQHPLGVEYDGVNGESMRMLRHKRAVVLDVKEG